MTHDLKFGWFSPVIGNAGSNHEAIVLYQQDHILPEALPYFDSLWIADHFYGFDARTEEYVGLVTDGVIHPSKVVRTALQNAASISGLLLTTDSMITDIKDEATVDGSVA